MKTKLSKILLLVVLGFAIETKAADRWETLRAINWVENPTNQTRVGRYGELGPYQFRPTTWRMHTDKPFNLAVRREVADEVAIKHYEWIKRAFEQAGVEASPFNIALAWNCGVDAVLSGRAPGASYNYATRVNNLVQTFKETRPEVTSQPVPSAEFKIDQVPGDLGGGLHFEVLQDAPRFLIAAG